MAEPLGAIFRRPFAEQVAAYRLRLGNLVPTAKWDDIQKSAHDRAFMVAGAMKADLLADLAKAVDAAVADGESLEQFRARFRQIVERRGWHGWTGEGSTGGEAWRTKIIYRTNMATSYAAGRRAQLIEGGYAFWVYRHGGSENPRLHHLAWDGLTLPPDHPFWETHTPVNDWGCSCYVLGARNARAAKRLGGDPDRDPPENWKRIDPKTGERIGIGKGWGYAPGASVSETVTQLARKLDDLPDQPSIDLIRAWLKDGGFRAWFDKPDGNWPIARLKAEDAERLGLSTRTVVLSPQTLAKQKRRHADLAPEDYLRITSAIDLAERRILKSDGRNMIFVHEELGTGGLVVVVKAVVARNEAFVTSFIRLSKDDRDRARKIAQFIAQGK